MLFRSLEGQLVVQGPTDTGVCLGQQLAEAVVVLDRRTNDDGIHEEADHVVEIMVVTIFSEACQTNWRKFSVYALKILPKALTLSPKPYPFTSGPPVGAGHILRSG